MVVFCLMSFRSYLHKCKKALSRRTFCSKSGGESKVAGVYDVNEVKHHEAMAKDWWDPGGSMKGLHAMNELRIPLIKNGLVNSHRLKALEVTNKVKFLEGIKILDVGCGGGFLSEALARLGGEVVGIEPSEELVKVARSHAQSAQLTTPPTYVVSTVEQHAQDNVAAYDVVVASEVIEHVSHKESFLAGCSAALKLGGSLYITTPNRTFMSWLVGIIVAENVLRAVPKGTHSYSMFIKPSELSVLLEKYGCSIQLVNGMMYNPLQNRWTWSSSKAIIYALHAIKIKDLLR